MFREAYAQKLYIDPHEYKQKRFKNFADALNCNTEFKVKVDSKSVRDRYERIQKSFDRDEEKYAQSSGVEAGVTEEEQILR